MLGLELASPFSRPIHIRAAAIKKAGWLHLRMFPGNRRPSAVINIRLPSIPYFHHQRSLLFIPPPPPPLLQQLPLTSGNLIISHRYTLLPLNKKTPKNPDSLGLNSPSQNSFLSFCDL